MKTWHVARDNCQQLTQGEHIFWCDLGFVVEVAAGAAHCWAVGALSFQHPTVFREAGAIEIDVSPRFQVVYALFIAIHTRAMRFEGTFWGKMWVLCFWIWVKDFFKIWHQGYHEGYTEHLPFWVSWTENLAVWNSAVHKTTRLGKIVLWNMNLYQCDLSSHIYVCVC